MTATDLKELSPFAALILVVYLLGVQWLRGWRETERERTAATTKTFEAITAGLSTLGGKVDAHHTADIESHGEMATALARIEKGNDDERARAERQTPAQGIRPLRATTHTGDR